MGIIANFAQLGDGAQRTLLLAPPSLATKEDKLEDVFKSYDRHTTDLQMLDRLSAGLVILPSNAYDFILVLTDTDDALLSNPLQLLNRNVYTAIVPSMKAGARLRLQFGSFNAAEAREAVLSGLIEKDGAFQKAHDDDTVAIPLNLGAKNKTSAQNGTNGNTNKMVHTLDNSLDSDDELIDENTLLDEEDLKRPQQRRWSSLRESLQAFLLMHSKAILCESKPGKRRRACKDCTCGLGKC